MTLDIVSASRCFAGTQYVYSHDSEVTNCTMKFSAYVPDTAGDTPLPVLTYLSGLTCTEENFTVKAAAQRHAAEHGLIVVAPDTSPRGDGVADDEAWDLGSGAGFYVNATQAPWSAHYHMYDYIVEELPGVINAGLPVDPDRHSLFGHSMGGHGTLIIGLRNPDKYHSLSVLAPISHPSAIDLGRRAFTTYLGNDEANWKDYDAVELLRAGRTTKPILLDQGEEDEFYKSGAMHIDTLQEAARGAGQELEVRLHAGFDHGYFFIQTLVADHIAWAAKALRA